MGRTTRGAAPAPPTAKVTELEFQELYRPMFERLVPGADSEAATLTMAVNRLATLMRQQLAAIQRPYGRSMTALHVLSALATLGPTTPSEIARLTRVTPPSVSSVLRGLRRDGLVSVTAADVDADGRVKLVTIQPAGEALLGEVMAQVHAREVEWARLLRPEDRASLTEMLRDMASEVEKMSSDEEHEPDEII